MTDIFDVLEEEEDRLDGVLTSLDESRWAAESRCAGWSVRDVVLHLAQTEEAVLATLGAPLPSLQSDGSSTTDDLAEHWVRSQRGRPSAEVHARWNAARRGAVEQLRAADPDHRLAWAAAPLKPRTLATTRLSEHWIHTLDITDSLGIEHPDSDNLHHIAWLAWRTIDYAFQRAGREPPPTVRLELAAPGEDTWTFGTEDAECVISGPAGEFCRVAARRLDPVQARDLRATGPRSDEVLELVRTYA